MEENELFGEAHEQEENGLFGRRHEAEQLNLCGVVKRTSKEERNKMQGYEYEKWKDTQ